MQAGRELEDEEKTERPTKPSRFRTLIVVSANENNQTEKCKTEKWRFLFFCLTFFCLVAETTIKAETLTVGPTPARYQTVQSAIAAAKQGDVIRVQPGVYTGQFILDKQITLEGAGKPIMRGEGRGSVVIVIADRCSIRGFVIEHSGGDLQAEDSGLLLKSNENTVVGNELRDVLYGIYLYHSQQNRIRGNTVRGRRELEVGSRGAGLHLWNSPDNTIEENTITEARDGMYIQSSPGNNIRRNRVFGVRYGLHYMSSDANKFEENVFSDNVAGAAIMYSRKIELRRNAFIHNRGFSSFGILFQDCEESVAEENFIINNATGVFAEALRKSVFRRNVIAENDLALQIFSSCARNLFVENNFVENISPLRLIGRRSDTRWQEGGRGNYWSDYRGYDLDGDGVGDVAHKVQNVFEYLEGNHPRLRLYLNSPAAQALAAAEHSFPIIKASSEKDGAPLMEPIALQFPLEKPRQTAPTQTLFALLSLLLAGTALAAMWRGRLR
jgi:nitrous oxidase accessory protein